MPRVTNLLLLTCWLLVQRGSLVWLANGLLGSEGTLHLFLAGATLVWVARALSPIDAFQRLGRPASGPVSAWLLAAGVPLAVALFAPDLGSVHAAAMLLSAYGLVGLFTRPESWRALRPLGLLVAAMLPITGHLDVLLGLPLRTSIAGAVASVFGSLETATVLQLESGYAYVDIPCSGVRSLWSSAVVLAGAAWVWRKPVGASWLALLVLTWSLVVAGNGARVALLVGLHHQLELPLVAEVLHLPAGVLTFVFALLPALVLLGRLQTTEPPVRPRTVLPALRAAPGVAIAALLASACVPASDPTSRPSPIPVVPEGWTRLPASDAERSFVEGRGGEIRKARFSVGDVRGTTAWITSRSWVTQHVPELCYASDGWTLASDHPARIADHSVRWADLSRGSERATAIWWFESATHSTHDHTERIAAGVVSDAPWLMVSVRLDGQPSPDDPSLIAVIDAIRVADRETFESPVILEEQP